MNAPPAPWPNIESGLVSIIIPAYNAERYLTEAIDSVLAQDYPHKQVIVVNDGSKDGTMDVLRSYGDRIEVIDQANAGPPRARNSGLNAARGEFIAFLDADDIWLPGKITAQVTHLQLHADVGTVFTKWHVWPPDADGIFRIPELKNQPRNHAGLVTENSGWIYRRLLLECRLLTTTVMMRASILRQIGPFDINLYNGDDYDAWLRASRVAKIDQLDCVGAYYRAVIGSVSRKARPVNDELVVIDMAIARWGLIDPAGIAMPAKTMRHHRDDLIIQFAHTHLTMGDPAVALDGYAQVLKRRPWRLDLWPGAAKAAVRLSQRRDKVGQMS